MVNSTGYDVMDESHQLHTNSVSAGLVSIIIPCYHQAHFLPYAIQSCINQNYSSLEIIVIDDGSPDDIQNALIPFQDRVTLIRKNNQGLSEARNTGIRISNGDFILFLDSDDILSPTAIASQVNFLNSHPRTDIVVCPNKLFSSLTADGRPDTHGQWPLFKKHLGIHLCFFNIAPPHAYLSRREAILQTGWFDPQLKACEDYDFWLRAAFKGYIPAYNPDGLVFYRRHPQSMSANLRNQYIHDAILHDKLSYLLAQHPNFLKDERLEAYLAFSSGALLTACRLYDLGISDIPDSLIDLAHHSICNAGNVARQRGTRWNVYTKLFCLRIIHYLRHRCFNDSNLKNEMIQCVRTIMLSGNAPARNTFMNASLLSTIAFETSDCIHERKELARLLLRLQFRIL